MFILVTFINIWSHQNRAFPVGLEAVNRLCWIPDSSLKKKQIKQIKQKKKTQIILLE